MAGYWNRDIHGERFTAYCAEHLPVPEPERWQTVPRFEGMTFRDMLADTFGGRSNLRAYLNGEREQYGGRAAVRRHADMMREHCTPNGYAYTPHLVGAPCAVCGKQL